MKRSVLLEVSLNLIGYCIAAAFSLMAVSVLLGATFEIIATPPALQAIIVWFPLYYISVFITVIFSYFALYAINFISLMSTLRPPIAERVYRIFIRFGAALPVSLVFSSSYHYVGKAAYYLPDFAHIFLIALTLALCVLPSSLLLSRELVATRSESEFSAITIGLNRLAYLQHIFLREQASKYHMVLLVSVARAVGEFLILFQVLEGRVSFNPSEYATAREMFLAFSTAITAQDNALLIFFLLIASVFGQVVIAAGTGLFR